MSMNCSASSGDGGVVYIVLASNTSSVSILKDLHFYSAGESRDG